MAERTGAGPNTHRGAAKKTQPPGKAMRTAHKDIAEHIPEGTLLRVEHVNDDGSAIVAYEQQEGDDTLLRTLRVTPAVFKKLGRTTKKFKRDQGET